MSEDRVTDGQADDDTAEAEDAGPLHRAWRAFRTAGQWVADTFKGHSGAYEMRNRER